MSEVGFLVTQRVSASPERVWATLGDFGNEHTWTRSVASCTRDTPEVRVGTSRICKLPRPLMGRTEATETLTEYEPGRALAYTLHGEAGPFAKARSRWSIVPDGSGGTLVSVEGAFVPKNALVRAILWPLARPAVKRLTRSVIRELNAHVAATT